MNLPSANCELLLIILIALIINCHSLSPIPSNNKWFPRDINTEQALHTLLGNIEDKVRSIDSIRFSINRLEVSFARMTSKLDSIESQLSTVQTSVHIKMRDIYEVLLKHDFQREQMIQKCEASQSRLLHKINLLETRFDESINKLQGNSEVNLGKVEIKQNEVINKVGEINNNIDTIKSYTINLEDKINNTQKELIHHMKNSQLCQVKKEQIDKIENKINGLHTRLNKTEVIWTQNDSPPKGGHFEQEQMVNDIKIELHSEAQKVGNKVSNMYNDVWKKISQMESLLKESILQTNTTQKDLQEDLRQIFIDQRDNEGFLDIVVDRILAVIKTKFSDLHRRMENNFQSLLTAQNLITNTCQRMHDDESGYWSRVELILEKILDTFFNKTNNLSKQSTELLEAIKGHNSQMIKTVSDAKSMVITLAEENSHDHKDLDSSILEVMKRADIIASAVDELQDQFEDMNGTIFSEPNNFQLQITDKKPSALNNSTKTLHFIENTTALGANNKTVNVVEANFNNGVIKIITDELIPSSINTEKNENITLFNTTTSSTTKPNDNQKLKKNSTNIPIQQLNTETETDKILNNQTKDNNNEEEEIDENEIETTFIITFINFIKGQITKEEFLQESFPGKSFKNIQDMIAYMKSLKVIRNEYLRELDKYDREDIESEIVSRRHDLFDTANFDYVDASDEFMSS